MFYKMNLLIKWFNGNVPFLCYINIYPIIILIILSSSGFLVQADVVNNLKAENEEPNLSQPNISSTDEYLRCEMIFFYILEQVDDGLMIGIPLGEDIYSPLKIQPIISLGSDQLIGMPLFSNNTFDCSVVPLLNEEKERQERQVQEEEYFLLMNNFYEQ